MNKFRALRKTTGLSMQKFGDMYGIPMRTVQGWELDKTNPPEYIYTLLEKAVKADMGVVDDSPTLRDLPEPDVEKMNELCDELIRFIRLYR